jgi:membrane-associated phospholipid phosphatase
MKVIILLQDLEPQMVFRLAFSIISWCGDGILYFLLFPLLYWRKSPTIAVRYGYLWGFAALALTVLKQQNDTLRPFLAAPEQIAFLKYPLEGLYWFPDRQTLMTAYRHSPSFPSGHALFSAALGMYLFTHTKTRGLQGLLIFLVVMIPVARLYLGVHYAADVLAGSAIGLALWGLATRICWEALSARLSHRGWHQAHRQLLLVVLLGVALAGVSKQAFFVLLLFVPYPMILTLAEQPIHRLAENGASQKTWNALVGCCGAGIILLSLAPLWRTGSLVSVPVITTWTTLGGPLLVEKGGYVLRILRRAAKR